MSPAMKPLSTRPKRLRDATSRQEARATRDYHWSIMERIAATGTLHISLWNKYGLEKRPDELLMCLFSGQEFADWVRRHRDWFVIGKQEVDRYTNPVRLTKSGRAALANREPYDMEDVHGGLVEPGFVVRPASSKT